MPSPDPPDDALSVSWDDSASRYSLAPSTDARRGVPWSAAARTAPKMAAALPFLPEAEYPGLLAGARASCPHGGGVADAGHRYVF